MAETLSPQPGEILHDNQKTDVIETEKYPQPPCTGPRCTCVPPSLANIIYSPTFYPPLSRPEVTALELLQFKEYLDSHPTWAPVDAERYGPARPKPIAYPAGLSIPADPCGLDEYILSLNRYLLDGYVVPPRVECAYQKPLDTTALFQLDPTSSRTTKITEIARSAVAVAMGSHFLDGNIRTAVLLVHEYLAAHKIRVRCTPLPIFVILGLAASVGRKTATRNLVGFLAEDKRVLSGRAVDGEYVRGYRAAVKELPVGVTQLWMISEVEKMVRWNTVRSFRQVVRFVRTRQFWVWEAFELLRSRGAEHTKLLRVW